MALNQSEKCNYNPNLVLFNTIRNGVLGAYIGRKVVRLAHLLVLDMLNFVFRPDEEFKLSVVSERRKPIIIILGGKIGGTPEN